MAPTTLLASLTQRGFLLRTDGETIFVQPPGPPANPAPGRPVRPPARLTDWDRAAIKRCKATLVALVLAQSDVLLARIAPDLDRLYLFRPLKAVVLDEQVAAASGNPDALLTLHSAVLGALVDATTSAEIEKIAGYASVSEAA